NYSTALRMFEQIRRKHEASNDSRRIGMVEIERAEIYLQLNLFEDAAVLAKRAFSIFDELGNAYEAAECLTFLGIAEFKMLDDAEATKAFEKAREIFAREGNETWIAVVDLWRAQLLIRQHRPSEAQELARNAAEIFERQQVPVRAANAR